ncbi:MAG TPA: type I methionyl aminopeptidase [Candidatus Paceibacterota bacterium]
MIAKTEEDIVILREGGRRLANHLQYLLKMLKPGLLVRALEEVALERVKKEADIPAFLGYKAGKNDKSYPSALCVSINDCLVHGPAGENQGLINDGDIVSLDFGIKHRGLFTDAAVTTIVGNAKEEDARLVRGTYEALAAGIASARIGNTTGDIGYAVEQVAKKYGFGFPRNLSGHGVGNKVHEEPHVPNFGSPGTGTKLIEGLVIAIEPMFAIGSGELFLDADAHSYRTKDGSRTAHAEHTILVTKSGPEVLTKI